MLPDKITPNNYLAMKVFPINWGNGQDKSDFIQLHFGA